VNLQMPRLAYLINQYPKVSHSFIRREIQALERQGFTLERIAMRGWSGELVDKADRLERERTRYLLRGGAAPLIGSMLALAATRPVRFLDAMQLALRTGWRNDRPMLLHLVYLAEACLLVRWLARDAIGHVHAHFGTNPTAVAMLAQALGGPTFSFTVHGPEEFDKPAAIAIGEKLRRSAFAVAISSFGRSQLYRHVEHAHWPKINVVHCGVDAVFAAAPPAAPRRSQRLVCIGRLCEQKGQLLLIEAAALLIARGIDFELVLAGDGEMRPQIEARITGAAFGHRIRITGWISSEQVRSELLAARALVLPSFAEGLPVLIMEAMALERAVISTYVAGIPELVIDGEHGWLVPAGDVEALADAMQACLAADPAVLQRMGTAARRRTLVRHDADTEAVKLGTLFRSIGVAA
jgi:colanic acid/amylovoran biosynthesis glycosyltransferase